ncbi:hypothetical protein GGR50DRAFT_642602 [Xylaria sp. CBS 124048]|nr:hypothetical protein GGR50DRAFT_642602 [Xylaria sp. CBS 124048]
MVKSLVELCTTVCVRNSKDITDVGAMPYRLVRPILQKIDSAAQLRQLEVNSPHLQDNTAEHWKRLIRRDFPVLCERNKFVPSNPTSWHKIYAKYQRIDADQKRKAQEKLVNAFKEIKKEKDDNVSQVVNYDSKKLPRLPRDVKPQVGIRPKGRGVGADQSELRFTGGSRTKVNTPKSLLTRARREAKEISYRNRLNAQAGAIKVRPRQITRAPAGMVHDKINSVRTSTGIPPPATHDARKTSMTKQVASIDDADLEDLEIAGDGSRSFDHGNHDALFDQPERHHSRNASPPSLSASSRAAKRGTIARKTNSSPGAPSTSTSRLHVEAQSTPKLLRQQRAPDSNSAAQKPAQTSPPPPKPLASTSSASASPGLLPLRKRKAVEVFMKPKPKVMRN